MKIKTIKGKLSFKELQKALSQISDSISNIEPEKIYYEDIFLLGKRIESLYSLFILLDEYYQQIDNEYKSI